MDKLFFITPEALSDRSAGRKQITSDIYIYSG